MAADEHFLIITVLGLIVFLDAALSIGWYKQDLRRNRHAAVRTLFRLVRLAIGGCLVLISYL